jgi:hypothetical protein
MVLRPPIAARDRSPASPKRGCRVASSPRRRAMSTHFTKNSSTPHRPEELDRLADEIAELSAHLDAATARLLALIREFDARGGWNTGFRSCAHWLSWRVGLELGRPRVCPGRPGAGDPAAPGRGLGPRRAVLLQGAGPDPRGDSGDRSPAAGRGACRRDVPRRAHRAGLEAGRPACGSARGQEAACKPGAPHPPG